MPQKLISEFYNKDKSKIAKIVLEDEILILDFYEENKYTHTIRYPSKTFRYVSDAAENFVLGHFSNYKEYSEV
jgi:hypothetical protein